MSDRLSEALAAFVDQETHAAAAAPADLERETRQVGRAVARRRAVRATVVSVLTATVVVGVAAGAMSLAGRQPLVPPAVSTTDAPPAPTTTPAPTGTGSPTATETPTQTPTESVEPTGVPTGPAVSDPAVTAGEPDPAFRDPTSTDPAVVLSAGADGVTVTDRLRLRSQPQVADSSATLGFLPTGTTFHVVGGPVLGSGYWWYHVTDLSSGASAQDGWVASAAQDGTPWIAAAPSPCRGSTFTVGDPTATSLADLKAGVVGTWVGCVITPWVSPYQVSITFRADGTYSSTALTMPDGIFEPALYYGVDGDAPGKTYALKDLLDDSTGVGQIDVVFDAGNVLRGDLRNVRLHGDRLEFEFFHRGTYGPLVYQLTRSGPGATG